MATAHLSAAPGQAPAAGPAPQPVVSRAGPGDAPALASVFMDAFPAGDAAMARMFPPGAGADYQRGAWARFVRWAAGADDADAVPGRAVDAHECNVLVVRGGAGAGSPPPDDPAQALTRQQAAGQGTPRDGSVQSAALLWVVGPDQAGVRPWRQRWPPAAPGMAEAEWVSFQDGMAAQHDAAMGAEPHVYVEIIMTHSSARRRGHASALLRAACAVADARRTPLYLDAQPAAMALYARHGFVARRDLAAAADGTPTCPMVRQPPPSRPLA